MSDNSGYFIVALNIATARVNIWKYLFASSGTMPWQIASNMGSNVNNQIKISDTQLFFLSLEPTSPYNLQMYKVTYGNTAVDWANRIMCPSTSWNSDWGETLMSSDNSIIYSVFLFGDTSNMYSHFVSINSNNGIITGTRYISSVGCIFIDGASLFSNYLTISMRCPSDSEIIVVDLSTNIFNYRQFSAGEFLLNTVKDPSYLR